jgi:hypothetical protein
VSPAGQRLNVAAASAVLALTLSFIALRIGRYRGELGAALAEAQSVD